MKESFSPQSEKKISREEVLEAYKKFADLGYSDPAQLGSADDPKLNAEVKETQELEMKWMRQLDKESEGNPELQDRANLSKTMLWVDAGYHSPQYLDEVLNDWLVQDLQNVEEIEDRPGAAQTRLLILEAMKKIKRILAEHNTK